ncbi:MAG: long-chain fatty acid--CoA ligase, partial [Candidatus Cloacimonetes bacterium]|nr:long-chain fatty acid--CoA ligase [Candidatus Cloacimonadota bacterium]
KNVIIGPNGDNIYAEEVEAKLNEAESVLESLVYESGGNIVARVFLNYEILDKLHGISKMGNTQKEPFEKTPTQKIKRFLYQ